MGNVIKLDELSSDNEEFRESDKPITFSDSDSDDFEDSEDESSKVFIPKKSTGPVRTEEDEEEEEDDRFAEFNDFESAEEDNDPAPEEGDSQPSNDSNKLKKLTPRQLEKEQKRIKKTGVCYLSKIPPYMKPAKLRSVLSRFGKIDRLFLKPEDATVYHKRVKYGGNKKKNFTEGWVEFVNKKDAKLCASSLNANILGGKKTSYYYDDVINMKYLPGFKWFDLTQQISKENEIRQAKLALEISQSQKLNKHFINNVEKSKMITGIQKKRKQKEEENSGETASKEEKIRRNFKQRKVTSTRADSKEELKENSKPNDKLSKVLSQVF